MGFDPIGPYALSRWDLVVAGQIITWRVGSGWRIWLSRLPVSFPFFAAEQFYFDEMVFGSLTLFAFLVLTLAPALRWRKEFLHIVVSGDEEGLRSDLASNAGIFKWCNVGASKIIGSRCYISVNKTWAIVFPLAATSQENLQATFQTIEARRAALIAG